jgi:signal transduction histidine kinase
MRRLAAVAELGQRALAIRDIQTLMDHAVALVARTLVVDYCSVLQLLPNGSDLRHIAGVGWPDGVVGQTIVPGGFRSQAGYTLGSGASVVMEDLRTETRFEGNRRLHEQGVVSGVSVIIAGAAQPFGVMSLHTRYARRFTIEDVHFLEALANVLASAIERAETNELLEQRVTERTRELSAILEVSRNVASTLELVPLLGLILDQLKQVVDYTGAAIFTVEEEQVRVVDYRGPLARHDMLKLRVPLKQALGYQAVSYEKGPVIVDVSWSTHPLAHTVGDLYAYLRSMVAYAHSWLVVPLMIQERVFGVVRIDHAAAHAYTPHHATLAMAFATHVAVAIENARLYEQAREAAAMQERYRLARELHDSVTQALYGVTMYAEAATALLATKDHETAANYLHVLRDTAQDALREMRLLIFELRPPVLAEEGLIAALQARLAAVESRVGSLATKLNVEGDIVVPAALEQALYGIAQESLNNVFKHAKAQTVTLSLQKTDTAVALEIVDDGVGFDPATLARKGGLGLRGMEERVAQIGGRLNVRSAPGQGTTIRVEISL